MSFGKMPIANNFLSKADFKNEFFYEMKVGFNENYSLFKLLEHPKPEQMFNSRYPFLTGSSKFMVDHFQNFSEFISKNFIKTGEKIIEVGCNDGTMLNFFDRNKFDCLGFEPSTNIAKIAEKKNLKIIPDFFSCNHDLTNKFINKTKVIYAANVICHIPDLNNLIKNVDKFLSKDGLFIFEVHYLDKIINDMQYDMIYHEHIYYHSLLSLENHFRRYDMKVFDVKPISIHAGSMRYYVCKHNGRYSTEINERVALLRAEEKKKGFDKFSTFSNFAEKVQKQKITLMACLSQIKKQGKTIAGYGASGRANTIIQYCKINHNHLEYIIDDAPAKQGFYTPGSHFLIRSSEILATDPPDYLLVFAWSFLEEILNKTKTFVNEGGKMIVPLPEVRIITDSD